MANVPESSTWESGVYQFETNDLIQGGPGGVDNRPHEQLGNRTRWLKDNSVMRDGSQALTGNLPAGGKKLTGLGAGTAAGDSLAYGQADARVGSLATGGTSIPAAPSASGVSAGAYSGANPVLQWFFGSESVGNKLWDAYVNGKQLIFRILDDANTGGRNWMTVTRNGVAATVIRLADKVGIGMDPVAALDVVGSIRSSAQITGTVTETGGSLAGANADASGFLAQAPANRPAYIGLVRSSQFGALLGLDTDNKLKIGGWSMGNVAYEIWHAGNLNYDAIMYNRDGGTEDSMMNGFWRYEYGGYSRSFIGFNAGGSVGQVNMMFDYTGRVWWRNKTDNSTWTGWKEFYHTGNFNPASYAPLNGVGANGTWPINISGSAPYATNAGSAPWAGITGKPDLITRGEYQQSFGYGSGYQRLPSGMILQWVSGTSPTSLGSYWALNFPIQFPNSCLFVIGSDGNAASSGFHECSSRVNSWNTASATMRFAEVGDDGPGQATPFFLIAIGY